MRKNKIHILSTGPLSADLTGEAEQYDIAIDEIPFIHTEYLTDEETQRAIRERCGQTLTAVFTSAHAVAAVAAIGTRPLHWNLYCIGNATREAVGRLLGTAHLVATAPDAGELARRICEDASLQEITFFCGDRRRDDLAGYPAKKWHCRSGNDHIQDHRRSGCPHQALRRPSFFQPQRRRKFLRFQSG